jgi:hypothetical protein
MLEDGTRQKCPPDSGKRSLVFLVFGENNILTTKVITLVNNWGLGKRSSCVYHNTSSSGWQ